jgi:hypothetical protein
LCEVEGEVVEGLSGGRGLARGRKGKGKGTNRLERLEFVSVKGGFVGLDWAGGILRGCEIVSIDGKEEKREERKATLHPSQL